METAPWYQSAIVRQQIVAFIVAGLGLAKITTDIDIDATVAAVFAGIAAIIPVYTILTRIFKPAPNLSQTAVRKEIEMVADGKIPASPTGPASRQGGFLSLAALFCIVLLGAGAMVVSGCVGTTAAYKTAQASEQSLPDTAYVVAEHYAIIVKEAADLAQSPGTPQSVKDAMKTADALLKPIIVGDATHPGIRTLVARYQAVQNATTQLELQTALNDAIRELANLITAVKTARRNP